MTKQKIDKQENAQPLEPQPFSAPVAPIHPPDSLVGTVNQTDLNKKKKQVGHNNINRKRNFDLRRQSDSKPWITFGSKYWW
jgi:hypothetical protein